MLVIFAVILAAIQALMFAFVTLWIVMAALRHRRLTPDEEERAMLRSLSWPSDP